MYVATSWLEKVNGFCQCFVVVDSSEAMSLDTVRDVTTRSEKGCHRFITDVDAFIAFSEGFNLTIEYDPETRKPYVKVIEKVCSVK